jgi:hypothetical protein
MGQPLNSWALMGHERVSAPLPFLPIVGRGPLGGEVDRFSVHFSRGRPGVTCAHPLMGRGDNEMIKMPKRGVNWAFLKINCKN